VSGRARFIKPSVKEPGMIVRDCRLDLGLLQSEVAELSGTAQSAISRMECGSISPTFATVERVLHSMGYELLVGARRK
jgi:predicted transcriptional regulator